MASGFIGRFIRVGLGIAATSALVAATIATALLLTWLVSLLA